MTKQMLARLPMPFGDLLDAEADMQALLMLTKDFDEGRSAFLEKRAPVFAGE